MFGEGSKKSCPKCGRIHGEGRFSCPANGKQCRQCQQYGHFERFCRKGVNKIEEKRTQIRGSDRHQRRSERDRDEEEERRDRRDDARERDRRRDEEDRWEEEDRRDRERDRERGGHQRERRDREEDYSSSSEDEHSDRRMMGVMASARDPKRNRLVTINGHEVSFLIDSGQMSLA